MTPTGGGPLPEPQRQRLDQLFRADPTTVSLGARLVEWAPGRAEVHLDPDDRHLNFFGSVHGGVVFTLADIAFAVANNSRGRLCVALSVDVQYVRAGRAGRALRARAVEQSCSRRIASYLLRVEDDEDLVASFHALGYRTDRWHFGEDAWPQDWRAQA